MISSAGRVVRCVVLFSFKQLTICFWRPICGNCQQVLEQVHNRLTTVCTQDTLRVLQINVLDNLGDRMTARIGCNDRFRGGFSIQQLDCISLQWKFLWNALVMSIDISWLISTVYAHLDHEPRVLKSLIDIIRNMGHKLTTGFCIIATILSQLTDILYSICQLFLLWIDDVYFVPLTGPLSRKLEMCRRAPDDDEVHEIHTM